MTELTLYKYINDNNIEWRWDFNERQEYDVLILPQVYDIKELVELMKGNSIDMGTDCKLLDGYFAFWMQDICDYYNIEIENVFPKPNKP